MRSYRSVFKLVWISKWIQRTELSSMVAAYGSGSLSGSSGCKLLWYAALELMCLFYFGIITWIS